MIGLEVDEAIDQAVARLRKKGLQIHGPVMRDNSGNFVHFQDPDGNEIYLWENVLEHASETGFAHAETTASH